MSKMKLNEHDENNQNGKTEETLIPNNQTTTNNTSTTPEITSETSTTPVPTPAPSPVLKKAIPDFKVDIDVETEK